MSNLLPPPDPNAKVLEMAPPAPEKKPQAIRAGEAVVGGLVEAEQTREPHLSKERLTEIAKQSEFGLHAYLDTWEISQEGVNLGTDNGFGFNSLTTHRGMNRLISEVGGRFPISEKLTERLLEQGVTEVAVVSYTDVAPEVVLGEHRTNTDSEGTALIQYVVLGGLPVKGLYDMSRKAQDNYDAYSRLANTSHPQFEAAVLLPRTLADEFLDAAQKDPQLFRELIEAEVSDKVGNKTMWDGKHGVRPNFEAWHEHNNGIDRIALTMKKPGEPAEPRILEFSAVNTED